ncbi:hypothetical protein GCM10025782_23120 [Pedococcus ginsenosidimutans]|uniref:Uncharacterized protein n=1 Tax=Pedococcus ginsenosidimutans TaxID=490570 RepID=A0ABP8YBY8_9MICO
MKAPLEAPPVDNTGGASSLAPGYDEGPGRSSEARRGLRRSASLRRYGGQPPEGRFYVTGQNEGVANPVPVTMETPAGYRVACAT